MSFSLPDRVRPVVPGEAALGPNATEVAYSPKHSVSPSDGIYHPSIQSRPRTVSWSSNFRPPESRRDQDPRRSGRPPGRPASRRASPGPLRRARRPALAMLVGVTHRKWYGYEAGRPVPLSVLRKVAKLTDTDLEWLRTGHGSRGKTPTARSGLERSMVAGVGRRSRRTLAPGRLEEGWLGVGGCPGPAGSVAGGLDAAGGRLGGHELDGPPGGARAVSLVTR